MCLSLDPPYNFFSFSQSLFFVGFLEISLETVYPTIGIDGKRCRKIQKDIERWGKMATVSENVVFHAMLQTHACSLTVFFTYLGGSWLMSELFLGFGFVSEFVEGFV